MSTLVDLQRRRFDQNKENNENGFSLPCTSPGRSQKDASLGRKILGDRNGISLPDSPTDRLRKSPLKRCCDQEKDLNRTDVVPYDPVMNSVSTRPKFMRYNPNRRREFLILREKELSVDDKEGSGISLKNWLQNDHFEEDSASSKTPQSHDPHFKSVNESVLPVSDNGWIAEDCDESLDVVEDESISFGRTFMRRTILLLFLLFCSSCYIFASDSQQKIPSLLEFQCLKEDLTDYFLGNFLDMCLSGNQTISLVFSSEVELVGNTSNVIPEIGNASEWDSNVQFEVEGETKGDGDMEPLAVLEDEKNIDVSEDPETDLSDTNDYLIAKESTGDVGSDGLLEPEEENRRKVGIDILELAYARHDWYCPEYEEIMEIDGDKRIKKHSTDADELEIENDSSRLPQIGEFVYSALYSLDAGLNVGKMYAALSILAVSGALAAGVLGYLKLKNRKGSRKKSLSPPATAMLDSFQVDSSMTDRREHTEISTRPPMVELLGEFSVGCERSGMEMRSFTVNRKTIHPDIRTECFISTSHLSVESKSHGTCTSLGTEKSLRRKKCADGGQVKSTSMPTPVRRSNRIKKQVVPS